MSESSLRLLQCDECREKAVFEIGDAKLRAWTTIRIWSGAPNFGPSISDGPRGMRDVLTSVESDFRHLCPSCVTALRAFVREHFLRSLGCALGVPEAFEATSLDDEDVPF